MSDLTKLTFTEDHIESVKLAVFIGIKRIAGVSGFLCLGRLFQGQPNEAALCFFVMQYARPDAIAGAKVEGPARSAGGSSLAPAIARREAAGALAREV